MNVVTGNDWTTSTGAVVTEDAPRIRARGYRINNNAIINRVKGWQAVLSQGGREYYDKLYDASAVEDLVLPYFTDNVRQTNGTWGDNYVGSTNGTQAYGSGVVSEVGRFAEQAIQTALELKNIVNNQPGTLFEPPKYFQYSVDEGPAVTQFSLINTKTDGSGWKANLETVQELIKLTRFERKGTGAVIPPPLWRVCINGYRNISWAAMNVDVNLVGMRRMKDDAIIPEGYDVRVIFTPIHTEDVDLMSDLTGPWS